MIQPGPHDPRQPRAEESEIPDPASEPLELRQAKDPDLVVSMEEALAADQEKLDGLMGGDTVPETPGEDGDTIEYESAKEAVRGVFDYGVALGRHEVAEAVKAERDSHIGLADTRVLLLEGKLAKAAQYARDVVREAHREQKEADATIVDLYRTRTHNVSNRDGLGRGDKRTEGACLDLAAAIRAQLNDEGGGADTEEEG